MTATTIIENAVERPTPRLKTKYREEIIAKLREEFGIENIMQVPGLTKIKVNMGVGEAARDSKLIERAVRDLTLALPRIRDFRGLSPKQFDGNGNYTFGLTEQVMFHEIDPDKVDRPRGMDITIVTTATSDEQGRALLKLLGFPFKEA